jgi:hypothetical protein
MQYASRCEDPGNLTLEELKDGLWFCRIRKAELRKQAKGLQKVHLRDCLIDAQTKKQHNVVGRLDMYRTKVLLYHTMVLMVRPTKVRC